jgi:hypothetical protein
MQWQVGATTCFECPAIGVDCANSTAVVLYAGFYRPDGEPKLPTMELSAAQRLHDGPWWLPSRCPGGTAACRGGAAAGSASCTDGSSGVLCGACARGFHPGMHACERCYAGSADLATSMAVLVVAMAALVSGVTWYLYTAVRHGGSPDAGGEGSDAQLVLARSTSARRRSLVGLSCRCAAPLRALWLSMPVSAPRQLMTIAKVLISYFQILDVFDRFNNVLWPPVFKAFLRALNLSALIGIEVWVGNLLLPFECALDWPIGFHTRLLVTMLLPPLLSALIFLLARLAWTLSGRERAALTALYRSPAVAHLHVWFVLLLYPSLCRVALATFQCVTLYDDFGNSTQLLYHDPEEPCAAPRWQFFAAIGIIIYCIGIPLGALWMTSRYRNVRSVRNRVSLLLTSCAPCHAPTLESSEQRPCMPPPVAPG